MRTGRVKKPDPCKIALYKVTPEILEQGRVSPKQHKDYYKECPEYRFRVKAASYKYQVESGYIKNPNPVLMELYGICVDTDAADATPADLEGGVPGHHPSQCVQVGRSYISG